MERTTTLYPLFSRHAPAGRKPDMPGKGRRRLDARKPLGVVLTVAVLGALLAATFGPASEAQEPRPEAPAIDWYAKISSIPLPAR